MKPLRLEITGFGPYLDTQVVDFERLGEHGLFLIHGRTGSGKSSILDALSFALYGETTGGERDGQDMITTIEPAGTGGAAARTETKVVLDFEHQGKRYRVTRRPAQLVAKVRGEGTTNRPADASLEDLGTGEVTATKVRDVTVAVREMLRCDVDQFRQTVVLPQGDFRRVVTDDASRRAILTRIFRTEKFERLAERLKEHAKGLASQGKAIRAEREALLAEMGAANSAEIVASLTAAETASNEAAKQRKDAETTRVAAVKANTNGESIEADFAHLERLHARAAELRSRTDEMSALAQVVERATKAASLTDSRDYLDQRSTEHARLVAEISAAEETVGRASVSVNESTTALERLEATERAALKSAEQRRTQLESQRERVAGLVVHQASLRKARQELAAATERREALDRSLAEMKTRIAESENQATAAATAANERDAAREALENATKDLQALEALDALHGELKKVDDDIAAARADDARHRLEAAVRDNAPGLLVGALNVGEPCPVCGSVHHPSPSTSEDVGALTTAFETFGKAAALLEGLTVQRRMLVTRMIEQQESRGWSSELPARHDIEQRKAEAAEAKVNAETAKERQGALSVQLTADRESHDAKQAERTDAADAAARLDAAVKVLETQIATTLQALPEEYRDPAAFETNLGSVRATVDALTQGFVDAERAVQEATRTQATATATLRSLQGQATTAAEALERAGNDFTDKLTKAGFSDRADFEAAELEPEKLEQRRVELEDYRTEVAATDVGIATLAGKLEGTERPDLQALAAALLEAERLLGEAVEHANVVDRRRDDLRRGHERFTALEKRDSELADRRTAAIKLDHLANGQLAGRVKVKLETFVLQSIFHEVLEEGNRHLRHMTGGRYTLLLREAAGATASGLELDVRDNAAGGATRPVATLSGGEGFLASLALALGLSEVAQRRSGGTELGALFIDEGFGSLDAHALDQVVGILRGLQDGHRMVGVISHVEELKRRIPAQLHVVTGQAGSSVQMRLND